MKIFAFYLIHRIYLNELEPPANAPISLKLLKLIVTPADKSAVLAQEIAKETYGEITQRPLQLQLIDLLETIMVYKLPILSREEIQQMIGITDVDLKQTRFYQDVFVEGQQEGKQEGNQEEGVSIVLRLLKRQFGSLDSAIETRIRGLKLSVIEMLVDQLLDFTDISELKTWLEDH